MLRNPYLLAGVALVAVWWFTRGDRRGLQPVNGTSSTNPAISGGDSYGQITTVDVQFGADGADVVIDTTDLGTQSAPRAMMRDQGHVGVDAVSAALRLPVPLPVARQLPDVRPRTVATLQPVPSLSARPRYAL